MKKSKDIDTRLQDKLVDTLWMESKRCFETAQPSFEKSVLASNFNVVLNRVEWTLETGGDETDIEFAKAVLRLGHFLDHYGVLRCE